MDILLVPVILLLVMYATARSVAAGILASGCSPGVRCGSRAAPRPGAALARGGTRDLGVAPRRQAAAPGHVLVGATVPIAAVLAYGVTWEREALAGASTRRCAFRSGMRCRPRCGSR